MKVYIRFPDGSRLAYELGKRIGGGKEGEVYLLADDPAYCAKIYREPEADLRGHITALMTIDAAKWHRPDERHLQVAWPFGIAEDTAGQAIGFLMNTLRDQYLLAQDLFSATKRLQKPFLNWGYNVAVAADLAWMVGKLHAAGMLVCDLALENLAFSPSGRVELLDCDSFLFRSGGRTYGGVNWREDYSPPEGGSGRHTKQTDYFSLAVVICRLLLEEFHPFAGIDRLIPSDDERSPKANIGRGRSWLFHSEIRTSRGCPPRQLLPFSLRELARRAFEEGARSPGARPTAEEWYRALAAVGGRLMRCRRSAQHVYSKDTLLCPWCDREAEQDGHDSFPSPHFVPPPAWLHAIAEASTVDPALWPWTNPVPGDVGVQEDDEQGGGHEPDGEGPTWDALTRTYAADAVVSGTVTAVAKSGLTVDIGLPALLPQALIDPKPVGDLQAYVGRKVTAKIIHLSEDFIVLSQRTVLQPEQAKDPQTLLGTLHPGQFVRGRVKNIVKYGAFIDLGGVDGLVHVSEFPGERPVGDPGEILKVGQEVTVEILTVDIDQRRVSLSLKKTMQDDSWEQFTRTHYVGQFVHGKVKKLMPYGAFVDLGGVDGLLHVSSMVPQPVTDPGEVVEVGEEIRVRIAAIDASRRRVSLSLKDSG